MNEEPIPETQPTPIEAVEIESKPKRKLGKILGGCVFFMMLLAIILVVVSMLIAYRKIIVPNAMLQEKIEYGIQSIPFLPKTPKYLLLKSAQVHTEISSANIDLVASMSTDPSDLLSDIAGIEALEIEIAGPVDFNNPKNPSLSLNAKITELIDADLILKDKVGYFKLNYLPQILFDRYGLSLDELQDNPILNQWVSNEFESTYSNTLNEDEPVLTEIAEQRLFNLLNDKLLELMVLQDDEVDGHETSKITITLYEDDINRLSNELNELFGTTEEASIFSENDFVQVEKLEISVWIDNKDYYLRKSTLAGTFSYYLFGGLEAYSNVLGAKDIALMPPPGPGLPEIDTNQDKNTYKVNTVTTIKLSDFGETFDIQAPTNAVPMEQYMQESSDYLEKKMEAQREELMNFDTNDDYSGFGEPAVEYVNPLNSSNELEEEDNTGFAN